MFWFRAESLQGDTVALLTAETFFAVYHRSDASPAAVDGSEIARLKRRILGDFRKREVLFFSYVWSHLTASSAALVSAFILRS